jgi:hypothetical protein
MSPEHGAVMTDLSNFFATNRDELQRALDKTRAEWEDCRTRCRMLEEQVRAAEALLGIAMSPSSSPLPTLRAAMKAVLRDEPNGLPAPEIVRRIRDQGLYARPNGTPVDVGQVHNRVHHYPHEFERANGRIHLGIPGDPS